MKNDLKRIAVCLKMVPGGDFALNQETGTVVRSGGDSMINPLDLFALQGAFGIRASTGCEVVAITMGPGWASRGLREAIGMGADRGILLTGPEFAGSDTLATSRVLAAAVSCIAADLVIAGARSLDGETGHVGPQIAARLGWPVFPDAFSVSVDPARGIDVCLRAETGTAEWTFTPPGVITFWRGEKLPSLPDFKAFESAGKRIASLGAKDIGISADHVGRKGSATRVIGVEPVRFIRKTLSIDATTTMGIDRAAEIIATEIGGGELSRLQSGGKSGDLTFLPSPFPSGEGVPEPADQFFHGPPPSVPPADRHQGMQTGNGPVVVYLEPWECRTGSGGDGPRKLAGLARSLADQAGARLVFAGMTSGRPCTEAGAAFFEFCSAYGAGESFLIQGFASRDLEVSLSEADLPPPSSAGMALAMLCRQLNPLAVLGSTNSHTRAALPYAAMLLETGITADCTALWIDPATGVLVQQRPAAGGNILARIVCDTARPQMATARPGCENPLRRPSQFFSSDRPRASAFTPDSGTGSPIPRSGTEIRVIDAPAWTGWASAVGEPAVGEPALGEPAFGEPAVNGARLEAFESSRTPGRLEECAVVISVGAGLKGPQALCDFERVCSITGAGPGASREAVHRGSQSWERQVGLSGRTVNPSLYLALGISGAVQHLAGMSGARRVIAVNNDPGAQIFSASDVAITGDAATILSRVLKILDGTAADAMPPGQVPSGDVEGVEASGMNSVDPAVFPNGFMAALNGILEPGDLISSDIEALSRYSGDCARAFSRIPDAVAKPRAVGQVSALVKLAASMGVPIVPRGGGTGLSGGAVPCRGGVVVSFENMSRILEVDFRSLAAVVEPGVITSDINRAAAPFGLFYAGYPMSGEMCTIGGNVATNAGGGKAVRYGVTGHHVLGLEFIDGLGRVMKVGGKCHKDVNGLDILHLLVGSEGTLGLITKIWLKLQPLPKFAMTLLCRFSSLKTALDAVPGIFGQGIQPVSLEVMDSVSWNHSCDFLGETLECPQEAVLLAEVEGCTETGCEAAGTVMGEYLSGQGDVLVAPSTGLRERVWKIRRCITESFIEAGYPQTSEDISVPIGEMAGIIETARRSTAESGLECACFGHAGDGNVHVRIFGNRGMEPGEWSIKSERAVRVLHAAAKAVGGTISGEHGIGVKRRNEAAGFLDPGAMDLMRQIKNRFDPAGILNPGKVL